MKILHTWFDHLAKSVSYKEVQLKQFCLPVKTSYQPAETIDDNNHQPFYCTRLTRKETPGSDKSIF